MFEGQKSKGRRNATGGVCGSKGEAQTGEGGVEEQRGGLSGEPAEVSAKADELESKHWEEDMRRLLAYIYLIQLNYGKGFRI